MSNVFKTFEGESEENLPPFLQQFGGMNKMQTDQFGLKYKLQYQNEFDDKDWINGPYDKYHQEIVHEFSDADKSILDNIILNLRVSKMPSDHLTILEIGIARSKEWSSTYHLLSNKMDWDIYIGIDSNPDVHKFIGDWGFQNVINYCENSNNHNIIIEKLNTLGINKIDLLIIDGWHSINQCYNDFKYAEMIKPRGCVLLHDTNYHPGPKTLMECVDESLFKKSKYFEDEVDWGVGVLKRIK